MKRIIHGLLGISLLAFVQIGSGADTTNSLPPLATLYPADEKISSDPSVLLAENFDQGTLAEILKRWEEASNKDQKVLAVKTGGPGQRGQCLEVTATMGTNTGGHLYRRLSREVDQAYFRFYVRFDSEPDYIHHFVHVGGYRPSTAWPQGGAGDRPAGDDRITVGVEPTGSRGRFPPPGAWNLYCYWHEMKVSAGGRYWGNSLNPVKPVPIPRNQWQCLEVMVKLNSSPEKSDGELALWVDGKPAIRIGPGSRRGPWSGMGFHLVDEGGEIFEGFRWRKSNELKLNFFWLLHYVTENAARQNQVTPPTRPNRVWFDDIVVSTRYIGPRTPTR